MKTNVKKTILTLVPTYNRIILMKLIFFSSITLSRKIAKDKLLIWGYEKIDSLVYELLSHNITLKEITKIEAKLEMG